MVIILDCLSRDGVSITPTTANLRGAQNLRADAETYSRDLSWVLNHSHQFYALQIILMAI